MEAFINFWNQANSLAVIVMMAASLVLLYALFFPKNPFAAKVLAFARTNVLGIGAFITIGALVSSLVYSNVIGYLPCLLCWYTRIFFYPQVVLFTVALFRKDRGILPYSIALTSIGLLISTYHYITESLQYSPIPCSAGGVSCLTRYVYEYGFITIPFMGLIAFLTLFLVLLSAKRQAK